MNDTTSTNTNTSTSDVVRVVTPSEPNGEYDYRDVIDPRHVIDLRDSRPDAGQGAGHDAGAQLRAGRAP